jgi:pimeloyl-ACP methyl ester carboxylesterase
VHLVLDVDCVVREEQRMYVEAERGGAAGGAGRLEQPVLLVWGDRDVFVTPEAAKESISALPDARLVTLDAGHGRWLEHPDEVGRAVAEHLRD